MQAKVKFNTRSSNRVSELMQYVDSKFDSYLRNQASLLRQQLAIQLADKFLEEFESAKWQPVIQGSFLRSLSERNAFSHAPEKLGFSLHLTREAVCLTLSNSDLTIVEQIGIVSYLVEVCAREFFDPYNPSRVEKNLTASKNQGFFFTPISLAIKLAALGLDVADESNTVIDPACGTGTLLAISLLVSSDIKEVIGIESDEFTASIADKLLKHVCLVEGIEANIVINNGDFLEFLDQFIKKGIQFDRLIMNPPYGRVRFLESSLTNVETRSGLDGAAKQRLQLQLRIQHLESAADLRKRFAFLGLGKGTPEYSRLFLAAATRIVRPMGTIVAITPSSWLSDQSSKELRQTILNRHGIQEIWNFDETAKLFSGVNQPTSVILIRTAVHSSVIRIQSGLKRANDVNKHTEDLDATHIHNYSPYWLSIPRHGNASAKILDKLHTQKPLAKHPKIQNLRGELDLTAHKNLLRNNLSFQRLVRGDHIEPFRLKEASESIKSGFVDAERFLLCLGENKLGHVRQWRLALPQCTYMQKKKRLEVCLVPPHHVISNSCNYIVLEEATDDPSDRLLFYCAYLNSSVVEWRFRLFNNNNHAANYEIDELPIPEFEQIEVNLRQNLIQLVKRLINKRIETDLYQLEALIAYSYGLTVEEFGVILTSLKHDSKEKTLYELESLHRISDSL